MKAVVQIQDTNLAAGVSITGLQFNIDLTGQVKISSGLADVRGVAQRVAQRIQDSVKEILVDEVVKDYERLFGEVAGGTTPPSYNEDLKELDYLLEEANRIQQELSQEQARLTERRRLVLETDEAVKSYVKVLVQQANPTSVNPPLEDLLGSCRKDHAFQAFLEKATGAKR